MNQEKKNIVKSVAVGVLTDDGVKEVMEELRAKENRLQREITPIDQKSRVRGAYLQDIASLKGGGILGTLNTMLESSPPTLRRILELIFKVNSV